MSRIFSQQQRSISNMRYAAVAIRSINSTQRHIGVLYRNEEADEVFLLDLAWHHDLRNHPPGAAYFWIDLDIPKQRMRQVAAVCRKVWKANEKGTLPYAFSPPNDCFDFETGVFLFGPTNLGLTCASFVLAVFEVAGLRLVHYETWPTDRPGDDEWQAAIIEQLEESNPPASAEHIEAIRAEIGSVRYRPEDVAGAASSSPLPADFAAAEKQAVAVLDRLS